MKSSVSVKKGYFEARVTGSLLTASHTMAPLFTYRLGDPMFIVRDNQLFERNAQIQLYQGNDAGLLLECITDAMFKRENNRIMYRRGGIAAVVVAVIAWFSLASSDIQIPVDVNASITHPAPVTNYLPPKAEAPRIGRDQAPATRTAVELRKPVSEPAAETPRDGWTLPPAARAGLPEKLGKAAARGLFTVPLSSGHARTLYVFADPDCPNCQRMERYFEMVSSQVNVVIFPVTITGGEKSLEALTPVMALPEGARAGAWKRLFAADVGVGVPGKKENTVPDETQAEMARGAIGVNEVAYRAYRLPGTPWTISDDGRYVPQAVLNSPAALKAFMTEKIDDGQ